MKLLGIQLTQTTFAQLLVAVGKGLFDAVVRSFIFVFVWEFKQLYHAFCHADSLKTVSGKPLLQWLCIPWCQPGGVRAWLRTGYCEWMITLILAWTLRLGLAMLCLTIAFCRSEQKMLNLTYDGIHFVWLIFPTGLLMMLYALIIVITLRHYRRQNSVISPKAALFCNMANQLLLRLTMLVIVILFLKVSPGLVLPLQNFTLDLTHNQVLDFYHLLLAGGAFALCIATVLHIVDAVIYPLDEINKEQAKH